MSEEGGDLIIRRILVALDASPHSRSALEAAAELAARFQAELQGLFVEDVNLLRLAELPFAREVGFFSAARRRLDGGEVEQQLRARARRVHQLLAAAANRVRVQWTFRVARGAIASELLAAEAEADLIILGRAGWSLTRRGGLGSTARAILARGTCLTLILQADTCLAGPVLVVYDGSALARRALAAATALLPAEQGYLIVLTPVEGSGEARKLWAQAAGLLRAWRGMVRYRSLAESNVPRLVRVLRIEGCGTLVLPAQSALLQDDALLALLDEMAIPVLLVR